MVDIKNLNNEPISFDLSEEDLNSIKGGASQVEVTPIKKHRFPIRTSPIRIDDHNPYPIRTSPVPIDHNPYPIRTSPIRIDDHPYPIKIYVIKIQAYPINHDLIIDEA